MNKDSFHRTNWTLLIIAFMVAITGCSLLVWGFIIDPQGEIHRSVLIAFAEALIYVGFTPWTFYFINKHNK